MDGLTHCTSSYGLSSELLDLRRVPACHVSLILHIPVFRLVAFLQMRLFGSAQSEGSEKPALFQMVCPLEAGFGIDASGVAAIGRLIRMPGIIACWLVRIPLDVVPVVSKLDREVEVFTSYIAVCDGSERRVVFPLPSP